MTVIVVGAENHTVAIKDSVADVRDLILAMDEHETHIMLTTIDGDPVLIHRDMVDLVTT